VTDASATSYTATYGYEASSPLVNTLTFKQSTTTRLTTTRSHDLINRLTSISSVAAGGSAPSLPISFAYRYNAASQRTRTTEANGSYWIYQYDSLGQVISGRKYWADSSPVAGQQFEYGFDDIGNRTVAKSGGDETGAGLRSSTHTANALYPVKGSVP
jgi:YD repeat-containing protein